MVSHEFSIYVVTILVQKPNESSG